MKKPNVLASWSGGKDCCLALYRAMRKGARVKTLLNMVSRDSKRCCFHGLPCGLLRLQAGRMGIPLSQRSVPDDMKEYERLFRRAVSDLAGRHNATGMVFGDIYLDEHKKWVERVCADVNMKAIEPLWNEPAADIADEFISAGFEAIIVSCKADIMGREFIGAAFDRVFVREMKKRKICPCGENGEFHTLVINGPVFTKPLRVVEARTIFRKGFWDHWSLDVRKWE